MSPSSKLVTVLLASRPQFLTASASPVLVGSALGYAGGADFSWVLFVLALLSIMAMHAGANMANDYFDHISRNDWVNKNPTPFSGGSRFIQNGLLSPKSVLLAALVALTIGSALGIVIVLMTESVLILVLGLAGLLGGYFYTASPIRLGYRTIGEPIIGVLFGLMPVYGSYYLQTRTIDTLPLLPGCIVGTLVFLIILINEFPDLQADATVNKKTVVVHFGVVPSIRIYRIALLATFACAAAMLFRPTLFYAGLLYLLILPLAIAAIKSANKQALTTPGRFRPNQLTILTHALGSTALTTGLLITAFCDSVG